MCSPLRVSLLSRVCATLFSWKSKSPPLSPGGSLHAQEQFKAAAPPASILGDAALKVAPAEVVVSSMKRSLSFLWDWSKYRGSPQSTPGNSLHGALTPEEGTSLHGGMMPLLSGASPGDAAPSVAHPSRRAEVSTEHA